MSPAEFRAARTALGLSTAQLGRILGYTDKCPGNQVRRMEMNAKHNGHRAIMPPIALAVRYMLRDLAEGRWAGNPDLEPREKS